MIEQHIPNEEAWSILAKALAPLLSAGAVLHLVGTLGAGKTAFCRALIRSLGYEGAVKSPTFTMVEPYPLAAVDIYHFDLYRLTEPEELEYLGIRDYAAAKNLLLIEWPDKGAELTPPADLTLSIDIDGQGRLARLVASSSRGVAIEEKLAKLK